MHVHVFLCVCARVIACVRACVRTSVCVCVCLRARVRACVSTFNMSCCVRSVATRHPGPSSTRRTVVAVRHPSTIVVGGSYT